MMVGSHTPKREGAIPPNGWVPPPRLGVSMEPISKFIISIQRIEGRVVVQRSAPTQISTN